MTSLADDILDLRKQSAGDADAEAQFAVLEKIEAALACVGMSLESKFEIPLGARIGEAHESVISAVRRVSL